MLQRVQKHENYNFRSIDTLTYKVPNFISSYRKPSIAAAIMWNRITNEMKVLSKNKVTYLFIDKY